MRKRRKSAIIIDIDGTVALRGDRSPYEWHRVEEDLPNRAVVTVVSLLHSAGFHRIFTSGRDEICRPMTLVWLAQNGLIPHDYTDPDNRFDLLMRPHKDNRDDAELKDEWYRTLIMPNYEIEMVFDDRDRVVRMWRDQHGLATFQVAYGDF